MDIVIHSMGMPFNGDTVKTKSLGGSESAAYYLARELAKRGNRVSVFTTITELGEWDGVSYYNVGTVNKQTPLGEKFEWYARNTPHDVLLIQRHPVAFHHQFASKINIWQTHDLALYRTAAMANHGMWQVDAVTAVSAWHKEQIIKVYGFAEDFVRVVPNGVDPELYQGELKTIDGEWWTGFTDKGLHVGENQFKLLYQSRPERGLEHLVRPGGIMDKLSDSEAHLFVCGYDNTVPQMAAFYQQLEEQGKRLGNVTFLGALTKPQLAALQRSCDLAIYPTEFQEVSCITAMECMHAGLPMLTSIVGALPETCELVDAGVKFIRLKDGKADEDEFVKQTRHLMNNAMVLESMKREQINAAPFRTWEKAADVFTTLVERCFEQRRGTNTALVRDSIEHSDIAFAMNALQAATDAEDFSNNIDEVSAREMHELYEFIQSPEAYEHHYAHHQSEYYDKFEDKVIGEDVSQSTRFRGVASFIGAEMEKRDNKVVMMDYGCAHGHYIIPIAHAFRESKFVGVDVSERAIGAAIKWTHKAGLSNIEFINGDQSILTVDEICELDENGKPVLFDIIFAGEVLEHVFDYQDLLEKFRGILAPDGVIIVTTPLGRWEWTGTENFRKAREHLHHFDKQDIVEICGDNKVSIMCAPSGHDKTGKSLGSWVWMVHPTVEFNEVDYERKSKVVTPRETVSACLIVKDGEKTLRRCVESFIDWVDQVVIGVDPSTTDRTWEVITHLRTDFKYKHIVGFKGLEALKDGFDEARNKTIELAEGDWILWCDADEEIQQPHNLWKYLRRSQHRAIGFPQVHYSTNPPQVLTTDYPLRLFRRDAGIKFYGLVHEHPEIEVGKGVDNATIRHDMQFLHCGYVDEETRRGRFQRNLPLLYRDREKYPTRGLNRYLMLRDIAQGLIFEQEQTQGFVTADQPARAQTGVEIYEEMLEKDSVRSIIEALKYYSHCVAVLGRGFEVKVSMAFKNDHAPDLNANVDTEGRFHSREFFGKFMNKLHQEATIQYESDYL